MKHTVKITIIILIMFLITQLIGLVTITSYDRNFGRTAQQVREEAIEKGLPLPPEPEVSIVKETVPPEMELEKPIDVARIVIAIVIAILLATVIFFLLSRIKVTIILRVWFAFVVFICLTYAFTLILYPSFGITLVNFFGRSFSLAEFIAIPLAIILTFFKIIKRNILVHNFTELFIYPGFVIIFLPLFAYSKYGIVTVSLILIAISIYDMIAVWKTKHMVKLAKFQIKHMKIFTGFFLPYIKPKDRAKIRKMRAEMKKGKKKRKALKIRVEFAVLGGGDVAFPLLFVGTMLFAYGLAAAVTTILSITLALALLLTFAKKKPYPAMPFLTAGCFLGLALVLLFF